MNDLFFELIQVAIGTRSYLSHTPSADEWGELYAMAKKQSLVGVCFAGVQRLGANADDGFSAIGMPEMLYLTWMGMAAKIQQRNEVVNRQCVELQARLSADGFQSCVLKGQGVAQQYGEHLFMLRQSGDIDLYVDCGMKKAVEYVQKIAPTNEVNHKHVQLHVFSDTEVELHYIPAELHCPWKDKPLQKFFDDWNAVETVKMPNGQTIFVPCAEFQVVHLLTHAFRHLYGDGIGLRQMMDLYFALKNLPNGVDQSAIRRVVEAAGMTRFAEATLWVLQKVFNLSMIGMPWVPNPRNGEFLLNEIMMAGNYGHHDERINKTGESRWGRFWRVTRQNQHMMRFSKSEVLCTPLWRIWHFVWMRRQGYTQG